jgi:hypothetical protein
MLWLHKGRFTHSMPWPCRAHAIPLPCRAAKGLECLSHLIYTVRPCLIHTCHAMPMPRPCHALTMPLSRPRHSTAVKRRPVGYLPAFSLFQLRHGVPRSLLSEAHQSYAGGQCETKQRLSRTRKRMVAARYKKDDPLNCWASSSDISSYHADFHEGHGTIGAWQGRGTACVN